VGIGLAVALLLGGCPSPASDAGPTAADRPAPPGDLVVPAPVTAAPEDGPATRPSVTVDVTAGDGSSESALDVVGTPDGGALVLLGESSPGPATRVVTVSPGGERTGSLAVPGLVSAWNLHRLPDGTALVTGRLAAEDALGYAVVDLANGVARTVAAVPLDPGTVDAVGDSALSPDGRTVWLFSATLVDGTYLYLLTGHDLASGGLVASRDLFPELRATHARDQRLDVVGLLATPAGEVVLAVNAFPGTAPFWSPMLLVYDTALAPLTDPIAVAPRGASVAATALAMAGDGTAYVLVRGSPVSTLVALPPGGLGPEPRLEVTGYGNADELVIDAQGRAVLPGRVGARSIDLTTGATTEVDVGCSSTVTVRELASSASGGIWMLGGCFEEGRPASMLWSIP
jgi:hypothetical protein